jgi:hypothetical protein
LEFTQRADIKNPDVPGKYTLKVYTSTEKTPVSSEEFVVTPKPKVYTQVIVLPNPEPDGENGYYTHNVTVLLIGISNTGSSVTVHYSVDSGNWRSITGQEVKINLGNGLHEIKYYSEGANNVKEDIMKKDFKIDTSKPEIVLKNPTGNITTASLTYNIQGTVKNFDDSTKVYINDIEIPIDTEGNFSYQAKLKEGANIFTVVAKDVAGNKSEVSFTISVSTVIPKITISSPVDWQEINDDNVVVSGKVDVLDSIVTINGQNVPLNEDGSFVYNLSLADEEKGSIPIKVVATAKESGLSANKTIVIIYNPKPKEVVIRLRVGLDSALVNSEAISLDAPPFIDPSTNRTLVPLRFISQAFGAKVQWDDLTRSVTIKLDNKEIKLQIGNTQASIDGKIAELDQPPIIKNNRTIVPIRFIAESFGAKVQWDGETKTITLIYTP